METETTDAAHGAEAAPQIEELPDDPGVLRDQIEDTRQELGETVEALAAKVDVKAQAREKLESGKEQLRKQGPAKPAAAAVAALVFLMFRRRRKAGKAARS